MRIRTIVVAAVATGSALAGIGALSQSAGGATKPLEQDQTYQMYANVDAQGDLGSNHDALKVSLDYENVYTIKFAHRISSCAAVVQPGRAGGSDPVLAASSVVAQSGTSAFVTRFTDNNGTVILEPFMITVTCTA